MNVCTTPCCECRIPTRSTELLVASEYSSNFKIGNDKSKTTRNTFFSSFLSNSTEMAKIGMIFAAVQRGDHYDTQHFVHMCVVVTKSVVVICHVSHTLVGYRTARRMLGSCHPGPGPLSAAGLHRRGAYDDDKNVTTRVVVSIGNVSAAAEPSSFWGPVHSTSIELSWLAVWKIFFFFFFEKSKTSDTLPSRVERGWVGVVDLSALPCRGFFFATSNLLCWQKQLFRTRPSLVWTGRDVFCGSASEKQHFSTAVETAGCEI